MNPECPYARTKLVGDETYTICDLEDTLCVLEGDNECDTYEDFLREVEE